MKFARHAALLFVAKSEEAVRDTAQFPIDRLRPSDVLRDTEKPDRRAGIVHDGNVGGAMGLRVGRGAFAVR